MTANTSSLRNIDAELLERYEIRAPRYTSYPTAPQWSDSFGPDDYAAHLQRLPNGPCQTSLYLHLPFCRERCTFCGCNVVISKKPELAETYLSILETELDLTLQRVPSGTSLQVQQLHWGGGTPNYLTPDQMIRVHRMITDRFEILPQAEIALEMDPRVLNRAQVDTLAGLGFNRASFGLQDTNSEVQKAVNRGHSVERVQECMEWVRAAGFMSVNLDLIYGLPFQTIASWAQTLADMDILKPDRVAMYGFAFIPTKMRQQKYMSPESLPGPQQRFEQFLAGLDWFTAHDYEYIGLDHFALRDDELALAYRDHTLQRNFMGYTTCAGTVLLGFGTSAITNLQSCFVQNNKHLAGHERSVSNGQLPVERGMSLSRDDQMRNRIIQELMCFNSLDMSGIGTEFGIDFASTFSTELDALRAMSNDGLLTIEGDRIETTLLGHILLRNIAATFDAYLEDEAAAGQSPVYSKTI